MAGSGFHPHARCPKPLVSEPVGGAAGRSGFADVGQNALHRFGFGDEADQPHFGATFGGRSTARFPFVDAWRFSGQASMAALGPGCVKT